MAGILGALGAGLSKAGEVVAGPQTAPQAKPQGDVNSMLALLAKMFQNRNARPATAPVGGGAGGVAGAIPLSLLNMPNANG